MAEKDEKKVNLKKEKKKKKKVLPIIMMVILLFCAGGYFGYKKYVDYQKQLAEQKAKEEEERKRQLQEEMKRKEIEQARKAYEELLEKMAQAFVRRDYKSLKELAEQARQLAAKYNFDTSKIDEILRKMQLAIAMEKLAQLEKITDPYAYGEIRRQLYTIPRFPEIAARWDRLNEKTFQYEYIVLLDLAEMTAKKLNNSENPEFNYTLSKTYLKRAKDIVSSGKALQDKVREDQILVLQSEGYLSSIGKSFHPSSLYR